MLKTFVFRVRRHLKFMCSFKISFTSMTLYRYFQDGVKKNFDGKNSLRFGKIQFFHISKFASKTDNIH